MDLRSKCLFCAVFVCFQERYKGEGRKEERASCHRSKATWQVAGWEFSLLAMLQREGLNVGNSLIVNR